MSNVLLKELEGGRWQMVADMTLDNGSHVHRTLEWDHEPTHEELDAATRHMFSLPEVQGDENEGHNVSRKPTRLGAIYYGHHWGPPTWWLPRIIVKVNRERLFAGTGWLTHAYSASYHPFERDDT